MIAKGQLDIVMKPCSDNSNLMSIVFHFRYNQMLYGSMVNIPCSELSELETIIKREIENFNRIISWSNEDEE